MTSTCSIKGPQGILLRPDHVTEERKVGRGDIFPGYPIRMRLEEDLVKAENMPAYWEQALREKSRTAGTTTIRGSQ